MTREEKNQVIDDLTTVLQDKNVVYLADTQGMTVESTNNLRRTCFEKNVQLRVVKNTLLKKAMEKSGKEFTPLFDALHGTTAVMFAEVGNVPAKLIKDFSIKNKFLSLKGAYINADCYLGANQLDSLAAMKSKEEVIGDIIGLLQSPARNVISALLNQDKMKEEAA
jgi:large subunit ribosomal protein L10